MQLAHGIDRGSSTELLSMSTETDARKIHPVPDTNDSLKGDPEAISNQGQMSLGFCLNLTGRKSTTPVASE